MEEHILATIERDIKKLESKASSREAQKLVRDCQKRFDDLTESRAPYHAFLAYRRFFRAYEKAFQLIKNGQELYLTKSM